MQDIKVIDFIISPPLQEVIKDEIFSTNFTWNLLDNITYSEKVGDTLYGLNHNFRNKQKNILQPIFPFLLPIIVAAVERIGKNYSFSDIESGRIFMQLPNGDSHTNEPHIDSESPHWVFLYYVNDSDGDTVFYEKKSKWSNESEYGKEDFIEIKRIKPKQGTCVIFDGSIYHASSSPTKHKRCVVNFNYRK